jgi:hypothetical protein
MSLVEGYNWRKKDKEDIMAFFVCRLMNIEGRYLKDPISPAELLEPIRGNVEEKKKTDKEYLQEKFKKVLQAEK